MTAVEYERQTPANPEAEEHVLGACMLPGSRAYFAVIETGFRGEDFNRGSHRAIFEAISRLTSDGVDPDAIAVADELERTPAPEGDRAKNMLDAVGGRDRVRDISALVPVATNAPHHARIVSENARRRDLIRALHDAGKAAMDGTPFAAALDVFETEIERVRSRAVVAENVHSGLKLAERFYRKRIDPPKDEDTGVEAPYWFLPRYRKGSLYVAAGYTGDGKTVHLLDSLKVVCTSGHRAGYASLEMSGDELVDRLVAKFGVPYDEAQTGRIAERHVEAAEMAEAMISKWDFDVLDDEEVDPSKLKRWAMAGKYDVVFVDHLHRIEFADRFEIEKTVRAIRNMAKRLEIPVILAAQLNRASDKKNPFPMPSLSSLRETAVIEQEAAVVSFVYRERDPETFEALDPTSYIVAKNRFGKTGIKRMTFNGTRQMFVAPDPRHS